MLIDLREKIGEKKSIKALWVPFQYGGDQSLHGGIYSWYNMVRYESEATNRVSDGHNVDAIFFNETFSLLVPYSDATLGNTFELCGRITHIYSVELGDLLGLEYHHFDFYITLADGSLLTMNCEERPGYIFERDITLEKFELIVSIDIAFFDERPMDWDKLGRHKPSRLSTIKRMGEGILTVLGVLDKPSSKE